MKLARVSVALLVIQVLIVSTVALKYLYQRHLPACLDARRRLRSNPHHARTLSQPPAHR